MSFLTKFLFPAFIDPKPLSTMSLDLYNTNINGEQLQAVRNIAQGPRNDATYIIFGPPGTGKTTTIVEAILQVLKRSGTKIIVTASSNSACDEIGKRLCKYLEKLNSNRDMVRIYARSCESNIEALDKELLEFSNMYDGQFYPAVEILHEYRVVICTLSIVAKLATGCFGQFGGTSVYTHLFIDEVAASTEPESLMAITNVLMRQSCLIISGDHKQLGPILKSKRAEELGLNKSLMDRLMDYDCYRPDIDTGDYDRTIQTRLLRNYRSHPAIVNLYSSLFYDHSLEAHAQIDDVSLCEIWYRSRNKQYPIMFHAVKESSRKDKRSTSLYNLAELNVVMDYVKDLMYFGINGDNINESDIGIISPYKNQCTRIQEELNLRNWFGIETGSVETFQGKEKAIIIVSFARSNTETLGFLNNPRRLNVTISRSKDLLIMIGNPETLSLNSDLEYIIKECKRNNTFVGVGEKNLVKCQESVASLCDSLQDLSVEEKEVEKSAGESNARRRRRGRGNRGGVNSAFQNDNKNSSKEDNNVQFGEQVEFNEQSKNDNNDFPYDYLNEELDILQSKSETKIPKKKRKAKNAPYSKISKHNVKSKQQKQKVLNDKKIDSCNIESIFDELPPVPKTSTAAQIKDLNTKSMKHFKEKQKQQLQQIKMHPKQQLQQPSDLDNLNYTKEQILERELQEQQQNLQNQPHQQQVHNPNIYNLNYPRVQNFERNLNEQQQKMQNQPHQQQLHNPNVYNLNYPRGQNFERNLNEPNQKLQMHPQQQQLHNPNVYNLNYPKGQNFERNLNEPHQKLQMHPQQQQFQQPSNFNDWSYIRKQQSQEQQLRFQMHPQHQRPSNVYNQNLNDTIPGQFTYFNLPSVGATPLHNMTPTLQYVDPLKPKNGNISNKKNKNRNSNRNICEEMKTNLENKNLISTSSQDNRARTNNSKTANKCNVSTAASQSIEKQPRKNSTNMQTNKNNNKSVAAAETASRKPINNENDNKNDKEPTSILINENEKGSTATSSSNAIDTASAYYNVRDISTSSCRVSDSSTPTNIKKKLNTLNNTLNEPSKKSEAIVELCGVDKPNVTVSDCPNVTGISTTSCSVSSTSSNNKCSTILNKIDPNTQSKTIAKSSALNTVNNTFNKLSEKFECILGEHLGGDNAIARVSNRVIPKMQSISMASNNEYKSFERPTTNLAAQNEKKNVAEPLIRNNSVFSTNSNSSSTNFNNVSTPRYNPRNYTSSARNVPTVSKVEKKNDSCIIS